MSHDLKNSILLWVGTLALFGLFWSALQLNVGPDIPDQWLWPMFGILVVLNGLRSLRDHYRKRKAGALTTGGWRPGPDPLRTEPVDAQSRGMRSHLLYWPSLVVAAIGGIVVAAGAAYEPARSLLVRPMSLLAAGIILVLFLRLLVDPACRRGIDAANREMMGGQGFRFRLTPILDPRWGLFGTRVGSPLLRAIRVLILAELVAAMGLTGRGPPDLLLLAAASLGVVMMLSLIHIGVTTPAPGARGPQSTLG